MQSGCPVSPPITPARARSVARHRRARMVAQDLAAKLLEPAEASSYSPNSKKISFWGIVLLILLLGMQVDDCVSVAPVAASPLLLRGRNEINELLLAVHVEFPIDIAPVGDGRSFRYHQFLLNARESVSLGKNDENLEFPWGQAVFEGDVLAFRYERTVAWPFSDIGLGVGVLARRSGWAR